jgi:hypothetical protein
MRCCEQVQARQELLAPDKEADAAALLRVTRQCQRQRAREVAASKRALVRPQWTHDARVQ